MKTVFFDIDTQIDFMFPSGALYVPGAEKIVDRVAALNRYAAAQGIQVVSTMDAHAEDDPEFRIYPHHCVAEALGQRKVAATLLADRVTVPNRRCDLSGPQILLEKQTLDCFTNVNLAGLLDRWNAERYVVYGVVTEICVKIAAFGLLKSGRRVEIVRDAICSLNPADGDKTLADFKAAGGQVSSIATTI
jgi:nicotinamidase/pyrazinamidase